LSHHRNSELLRRIYSHQEPDLLNRSLGSTFLGHSPGSSRISGDWIGIEGFTEHGRRLNELSNGSFEHTPTGSYSNSAWGMVPSIIHVSRNGRAMEMKGCGVWRFDDDGRIAEHWEMLEDQRTWDLFWNS
jgi:hypothetical protein